MNLLCKFEFPLKEAKYTMNDSLMALMIFSTNMDPSTAIPFVLAFEENAYKKSIEFAQNLVGQVNDEMIIGLLDVWREVIDEFSLRDRIVPSPSIKPASEVYDFYLWESRLFTYFLPIPLMSLLLLEPKDIGILLNNGQKTKEYIKLLPPLNNRVNRDNVAHISQEIKLALENFAETKGLQLDVPELDSEQVLRKNLRDTVAYLVYLYNITISYYHAFGLDFEVMFKERPFAEIDLGEDYLEDKKQQAIRQYYEMRRAGESLSFTNEKIIIDLISQFFTTRTWSELMGMSVQSLINLANQMDTSDIIYYGPELLEAASVVMYTLNVPLEE